ncbi:Acid phosphatase/vanadium-dependent haloperoxidase-related protein [Zea mays]|uniref:Acid phosphatase/vanadium-dependent haloperoxidase-related protein n=2 Tax=Zea mays TaxID=4577 RepID=A0A1D6Q2V6_MAIZE|nr:Acid phosphatase/vanadium-dependent haloperoxidase-related protein [Zea mays]
MWRVKTSKGSTSESKQKEILEFYEVLIVSLCFAIFAHGFRHTFSSFALKELNHKKNKDRSTSLDSMPMKKLIVIAQARMFSRSTSFPDNFLNAKYIPETSINIPSKEGPHRQLSPSNRIIRSTSGNDNVNSRSLFDNIQQKKLAAHGANAARRSFKDFLSTLTRTKESISRATRLAMECAKFGIAGEVMYDAFGVRLQAGKQAKVLNQIVYELPSEHPLAETRPLRELLGHTPPQVFAGEVLGFAVATFIAMIAGLGS